MEFISFHQELPGNGLNNPPTYHRSRVITATGAALSRVKLILQQAPLFLLHVFDFLPETCQKIPSKHTAGLIRAKRPEEPKGRTSLKRSNQFSSVETNQNQFGLLGSKPNTADWERVEEMKTSNLKKCN